MTGSAVPCATNDVPCGMLAILATVGGVLRIGGLRCVDPESGLDVDAGGLAVRAKHMRILNLLQIPDAMQIDVVLQEAAIWNVARNLIELERLDGLVQFQEAVLAAVKRPPDLVEAAPLPGADEIGQRPQRVWLRVGNASRNGSQIEIL